MKNNTFIKMFDLSKFYVFNAWAKDALTDTEWTMLFFILERKLLPICSDSKAVNGNTVKIDRDFKAWMFKTLKITEKMYEAFITKLVSGGIFYRLKNDWFLVNPYAFCRGSEEETVKMLGVFRPAMHRPAVKDGKSPFLSEPTYEELVEKMININRYFDEKKKNRLKKPPLRLQF